MSKPPAVSRMPVPRTLLLVDDLFMEEERLPGMWEAPFARYPQ